VAAVQATPYLRSGLNPTPFFLPDLKLISFMCQLILDTVC
jgi:hypothetical protein